MPDLESLIRRAMLEGGVQALNLFRNADDEFQANIGFRDRGPSGIKRDADPAIALALALGMKRPPKPTANQFEDLLG